MSVVTLNTLYGYGKYADGRTFQDFNDAFYYTGDDIDYMVWATLPRNRSLGYYIPSPPAAWRIYRTAVRTNGIPDEEVVSAYIKGVGVRCYSGGYVAGWIVNTEGYEFHTHLMYGLIRTIPYDDPSKIVGTFTAPVVNDGDDSTVWIGTFNERGIALLESKRGSNVKLGFLTTVFPSAIDPPSSISARCIMYYPNGGTQTELWINANPGYVTPGYIWVEGTKLAYTDTNYDKRLYEGNLTSTTGKIAGHRWVEGDYCHYIDANGDERRILGSTTGLTGKQPSQISINTKSPMNGTKLCYIDSSGNERCFEGT